MQNRIVSVCVVAVLVFSIFGCARAAEDTPSANTESIAGGIERVEQMADSPVSQEESEPEEEIEHDYFNTYLPILAEYERAWEDETYTIEELQDVAGVFITLTDAKFRLGTKEKDYTLYYSMSDLKGDGVEELIIGIRGEDGIAPCFLYAGNGERIHITDSRIWSDLVEKPTKLYENGIVESTESIEYGMCRYNFYQLSFVYTSPREVGRRELINRYFYIEDSENGTRYYIGDIANPVTEEEFWNGIGDYESMPQIKLDWHELEGFWEPDEDDAKTSVIGAEHSQSEKEKSEGKAESAVIEAAASNDEELEDETETKKDEPVTVVTKMTEYYSDGSVGYQHEYEYDSAGREVKRVTYYEDEGIDSWSESSYDSAGNEVKYISYFADGRVSGWIDRKYDSAGNTVMSITYNADGSIDKWYGYEYDRTGNKVKSISILPSGWVGNWYAYEYDSVGNEAKYIRYYSDGRVDSWAEYEYDGAGRLMKETSYTDNTNFYWYEYEYDSAGNKVKEVTYKKSNGDILSWQEWEYDSAGNRVKWIMYEADGSIRDWEEYEYDIAGNLTKGISYYGDGSVEWWSEYEYEYDIAGNLTKKIDYDPDGKLEYEYEYITITPDSLVAEPETVKTENTETEIEEEKKIKDITWEAVDYNVVDLHFHLEGGGTVDREIIGYSVLDIVYEDITGDDADEVLIYCDFANNTCDWQLVYFYQINQGNVTDISPSSKDIPELKSNEGYWNTWIAAETMEGYSSPIYKLEDYTKEHGVLYVTETLYIGYKDGKWELVKGFDESPAADFFYYKW